MYKKNPKLEGSNLIDCKPQIGPCDRNCNQCFYNRDKKLYPENIPSKHKAKGKIVRMNSMHDSNAKKMYVIHHAKDYKDAFFNTSVANFDFPGPVVYTANPHEELPVDLHFLNSKFVKNLMFIRLRVSSTNFSHVLRASYEIIMRTKVPIVLTFMSYYTEDKSGTYITDVKTPRIESKRIICYTWKKHIKNNYWCPTRGFKRYILNKLRESFPSVQHRITMCGTLDSNYCRDCRNCEAYYWLTKRIIIGDE